MLLMKRHKDIASIKVVSSINGKPLNSLLSRFIKEKISVYQEPLRQGTQKGETIGYSLKKYQAMLLCLYNWEKKKIAEIAGVSYGLLRKWRTEEEFKQLLSESADEFSHRVIQESLRLVQQAASTIFRVHPKLGLMPKGGECEELFSDSSEYGEEIQAFLWRAVNSLQERGKAKRGSDKVWEVVASHIMEILLFSEVMPEALREEILLGFKVMDVEGGKKGMIKFLYDEVTRILSSKQALGKTDKQKLKHIIDFIMDLSGIDRDEKGVAEE
jgi:hypothetical protein